MSRDVGRATLDAMRAVPDQRIGPDGRIYPPYPATDAREDMAPEDWLVDHACPGCGGVTRALPTVAAETVCGRCLPPSKRRDQ